MIAGMSSTSSARSRLKARLDEYVPERRLLIKRMTKILLILSLMLLAGCSIDLSGPTHKPAEPIYIMRHACWRRVRRPRLPHRCRGPGSNLSGHLVYIKIPRQIVELDLASGQQTILFNAPNNAFVSAAQVSPDGKWIVMAYAPPEDPSLQSINTDLYVMPADGSAAPQVLLKRAARQRRFFQSGLVGRRQIRLLLASDAGSSTAPANIPTSNTIWSAWLIRAVSRKS